MRQAVSLETAVETVEATESKEEKGEAVRWKEVENGADVDVHVGNDECRR